MDQMRAMVRLKAGAKRLVKLMITLVERSYMGPVEGRALSREPASYILRGFYLPRAALVAQNTIEMSQAAKQIWRLRS
jgi:hypothetical protein